LPVGSLPYIIERLIAMTHRISVERNSLRFAAAHFTTSGEECEQLHGHNYDVSVEIEGDLTPDSWVLDFSRLKRLARGLCDELDHRFLLPLENSALRIAAGDTEYEIGFGERRYVIPRADVAPLPIDNSTAERLAEWLAERLAKELRALGATNLRRLTVGVEEAPGQTGWFELSLGTGEPG